MVSWSSTLTARAAALMIPRIVSRIPAGSRTVYLTFDDGPSHHTSDLLRVLDKHQAKATFFLLGSRVERYRSAAMDLLSRGHGVGNHSFDHLDAWRTKWAHVESDLRRGSDAVSALTGVEPAWLRPPYGRFRWSTLALCRRSNQRLALWDFMAPDYVPDPQPEQIANAVTRLVRPGSIIVLHDGLPTSVAVTERVLEALANDGFGFEALPNSTRRDTV